MSPERIAELRALAEKANPGPWYTEDDHLLGKDFGHLANIQDDDDRSFIVAARDALPEALTEIERLGRIIDKIEDLAIGSDWFDFPKNELLDLIAESAP